MKRNLLRLVPAGALALGMAAGTTTPVQAATTGTVTFTGAANVSGAGLVATCVDTVPGDYTIYTYDPVTKRLGQTTTFTPCNAREEAWAFNSTTCISEEAGKKGPVAGNCTIEATGTVSGYCDNSSGKGSGTYTNTRGQTYDFLIVWTTGALGGKLITGEITKRDNGQLGTIDGEANATPTTGSCFFPGATGFTITGQVTFAVTTK